MKKLISILVAFAMTAMLSVTAFAAGEITDATNQSPAPANAYLVKYLELDSGVTVPDTTFYFTFTPASDSSHAVAVDTPAIDRQHIAPADMNASGLTTDGNSQVGALPLTFLNSIEWPHAGEFTYTVKETDENGAALTNGSGWTYDGQTYTLHVYVVNDGDNLKVDKVTVEDSTGAKESITTQDPTDDDEQDHATEADKTNGFTFDNKYTKTGPEIDPDPDDPSNGKYGAFGVAKTVEGTAGNKEAAFPFTLTLANSDTHNADQITAYKYTVGEQGEDVQGAPITISLNGTYDFDLADGESLVIPNLPNGTTAKVKERLTAATISDKGNYTPDIVVKDNGETNAAAGVAAAETNKGKDVEMATTITINDTDNGTNVADVTNTRDDITPTGILMNNLPYIVLAIVAIGGLVAYVVVRRRQSDEA